MDRSKRAAWFVLAAAVAGLDLWSKALWEYPSDLGGAPLPQATLIEGWLFIRTIWNEGGVWSLDIAKTFLLVATMAAVPVLVVWMLYPRRAGAWETAAKAIILGGAVGNLYDRLEHGAVRDFIDVYIEPLQWHYPTFNVADMSLLGGIAILLVLSFRSRPGQRGEAAKA